MMQQSDWHKIYERFLWCCNQSDMKYMRRKCSYSSMYVCTSQQSSVMIVTMDNGHADVLLQMYSGAEYSLNFSCFLSAADLMQWSGAFFCFLSAARLICANSDLEFAPTAQQLVQKSVKQSMNCGRVWRECFRSSHLEGFKEKGLYLAPPHLIVHSVLRWMIPDNKLSHICLFACILCKVSYKE